MNYSNLFLKFYSTTLTFILAFFIFSSFIKKDVQKKFDEIIVERINVVEPDDKIKMVISNSKRQHPGMFDGKVIEERERAQELFSLKKSKTTSVDLYILGTKKMVRVWFYHLTSIKMIKLCKCSI